jgi:hypothetical protein
VRAAAYSLPKLKQHALLYALLLQLCYHGPAQEAAEQQEKVKRALSNARRKERQAAASAAEQMKQVSKCMKHTAAVHAVACAGPRGLTRRLSASMPCLLECSPSPCCTAASVALIQLGRDWAWPCPTAALLPFDLAALGLGIPSFCQSFFCMRNCTCSRWVDPWDVPTVGLACDCSPSLENVFMLRLLAPPPFIPRLTALINVCKRYTRTEGSSGVFRAP